MPSSALHHLIQQAAADAGGFLPFDRFMELALYAPHAGYYAHGSTKIGHMPADGSDFATAPEISALFGQTLALQVAQALQRTHSDEIWEFGAGSGALAHDVLTALAQQGVALRRYTIVDVSESLRARQRQRLAPWGDVLRWASVLPETMHGVVLGNELLDAMPVKLLARKGNVWHERCVSAQDDGAWGWHDVPTALRPGVDVPGTHDYLTEIHPHAEAFVRTVGERLQRGAAFFIDYGFGEREYYHAQRDTGTLMCHRGHRADADPLCEPGAKDITAHVNFTGIALAAQEVGLEILGYTTQGWFLLNCGIAQRMEQAGLGDRVRAHKLVLEHEMGELFKVIGFCRGAAWDATGFAQGCRMRML